MFWGKDGAEEHGQGPRALPTFLRSTAGPMQGVERDQGEETGSFPK